MFNLSNIFGKKNATAGQLTKEQIAKLLNTSPEALAAFENAYKTKVLDTEVPNDVFNINSRQANDFRKTAEYLTNQTFEERNTEQLAKLIQQITKELVSQTNTFVYDGETITTRKAIGMTEEPVKLDEIKAVPKAYQPDLTGTLMKRDISENSSNALLWFLNEFMNTDDSDIKRKQFLYHHFRQGLDILDLDPITYEIIGCNKNSMGHWLPQLINANTTGFFQIPKTVIAKVPLTLLQLTRQEYTSLSETTLKIVDLWAKNVFNLKDDGDYFIKTGTYSSKFDFRNCRVNDPDEIKDLGEYLLFIHFQALQMASPLTSPCIYGVSTTNEWVVREFIPNKDDNLSIYKGLPLHTEYRVFIDCDTDTVLGINPYWDPETMEKRFAEQRDKHDIHDAITYEAHKDKLMARYDANKDKVVAEIEKILPALDLTGQWSLDVMQNGDDFWLIDMALAENSAFYDKCVALEDRRPTKENWIPRIQ